MTLQEPQHHRPVGRPRSARAHQAIIIATLVLLAEGGFDNMSLEAVATCARVGKTTIYQHWPSKEALVIDALRELKAEIPITDTGNFRSDMVTLLRDGLRALSPTTNPQQVRPLFRVISEIYAHPELYKVLLDEQIAPRLGHIEQFVKQAQAQGELNLEIQAVLDVLFVTSLIVGSFLYITRAQAQGELSQDLDVLFVTSLIVGPLLYHALVSMMTSTTHTLDDLPESVVDAALRWIKGCLN